MKRTVYKYILLFSFFILLSGVSLAQQDSVRLKKEVEVVKAYQPSISDAFKINDIPSTKQENTEKPVFQYQIHPQPVFSTFLTEPVQAAEIATEPQTQLGNGLLKLGAGNYKTPYGEIFFNAASGKKTTFGIHYRHLSSHGKIKLENDDKVKAPQSDNNAEIFVNQTFRKAMLKATLFFDRKAFRYYGYTGGRMNNASKKDLIPSWNDKQALSKGGIQLQLDGNEKQTKGLEYNTTLKYQLSGSKTGQTENLMLLKGTFNKDFDQFTGQLDASLNYAYTDSISNDEKNTYGKRKQAFLKVTPSVFFKGEIASLRLGINSYSVIDNEDEDDYMLAPNVKADWTPIEDILTFYAGTDGWLQQNYYSSIAEENQFASPYHNVKNTKYNYILTGGIKGKFLPNLSYTFQVDYSGIKNQHFYYLNNTEEWNASTNEYDLTARENTFDVLYDDVKQLNIGGELHYSTSEELSILFRATGHSYKMDTQKEAWNKPGFEASFSAYYSPVQKPYRLSADIFYTGERKGLLQTEQQGPADPGGNPTTNYQSDIYKLNSIIDLNFSIEYLFNDQLSFWGRVNNFSFKKYELWPGYNTQGLNLLLGISYSF